MNSMSRSSQHSIVLVLSVAVTSSSALGYQLITESDVSEIGAASSQWKALKQKTRRVDGGSNPEQLLRVG